MKMACVPECGEDSQCHDALPVCDTDVHQCVGTNIIQSNRPKMIQII